MRAAARGVAGELRALAAQVEHTLPLPPERGRALVGQSLGRIEGRVEALQRNPGLRRGEAVAVAAAVPWCCAATCPPGAKAVVKALRSAGCAVPAALYRCPGLLWLGGEAVGERLAALGRMGFEAAEVAAIVSRNPAVLQFPPDPAAFAPWDVAAGLPSPGTQAYRDLAAAAAAPPGQTRWGPEPDSCDDVGAAVELLEELGADVDRLGDAAALAVEGLGLERVEGSVAMLRGAPLALDDEELTRLLKRHPKGFRDMRPAVVRASAAAVLEAVGDAATLRSAVLKHPGLLYSGEAPAALAALREVGLGHDALRSAVCHRGRLLVSATAASVHRRAEALRRLGCPPADLEARGGVLCLANSLDLGAAITLIEAARGRDPPPLSALVGVSTSRMAAMLGTTPAALGSFMVKFKKAARRAAGGSLPPGAIGAAPNAELPPLAFET